MVERPSTVGRTVLTLRSRVNAQGENNAVDKWGLLGVSALDRRSEQDFYRWKTSPIVDSQVENQQSDM